MNILIVPSWYESSNNQTSGSFFREQAMALSRRGHRVVVLDASLRVRNGWFSADCSRYIKEMDGPLTVYRLNIPSLFFGRFPNLYKWVYSQVLEFLLNQALRDGFVPALVHAHSVYAAGVASLQLARKMRLPLVVTEHCSIFHQPVVNPVLMKMLSSVLQCSQAFICVSESLKQNIERIVGVEREILVVPNMVDARFKFAPKAKSENFVFFSAGNLVPVKRMDLLIEAFSNEFGGKDSKVTLRIAGAGRLHKELQHRISTLGLSGRILLLGGLSRDEIVAEMQNCDAFVLASESETFGVVYREAMAVGRPIISTRNGGIGDKLSAEVGILTAVGDRQDLAAGMRAVKQNLKSYNQASISALCRAQYSEEVVISRLLEVYHRALQLSNASRRT